MIVGVWFHCALPTPKCWVQASAAGWVHGGRFRDYIERTKFRTSIAAPSLSELTIAEYLKSGGYDGHIRRIRNLLPEHLQAFSRAIVKYFPDGTRMTRPAGGYLLALWAFPMCIFQLIRGKSRKAQPYHRL